MLNNFNKYIIDITIETLTGTSFQLKASINDTIQSIKQKIQRLENIPVSQQHLIWQSDELEDNYTLKDYNIQDGAVLRLVLALRGGPINSRRMTSEDVFLRDITELIELRDDPSFWDAYPMNKQVTLVLFKDGDNYNLLRVVGRRDSSPLSGAMSATSMYGQYEEAEKDVDKEKVAENEQTKEKMQLLKAKMNKNKTSGSSSGAATDTNTKSSAATLKTIHLADNGNNASDLAPQPPTTIKTKNNNLLDSIRLKRYNTLSFGLPSDLKKAYVNNSTINELDTSQTIANTIKQIKHFDSQSLNKQQTIDYDEELDDEEEDNEDDDEYDQDDEDDEDDEDEIETQSLYNTKSALISAAGVESNFDTYSSPDLLEKEKILLKLGKKLSDPGVSSTLNGGTTSTLSNTNGSLILRKPYSTSSTTSTKLPPYYYITQNGGAAVGGNTGGGGGGGLNRSAIYNHQNKYISSADSMVSRNHTSSKMLQSAISLNNQNSSMEDLTVINRHGSATKTKSKTQDGSDVDMIRKVTTPQLTATTTNITEINTLMDDAGMGTLTSNDDNAGSSDEDTLALLQKRINFIMAHGMLESESAMRKDDGNDLQSTGKQPLNKLKSLNYKKLPPKFHTLYNLGAQKTSSATQTTETEQRLNETQQLDVNNNNNNAASNSISSINNGTSLYSLLPNANTTTTTTSTTAASSLSKPKPPPQLYHHLLMNNSASLNSKNSNDNTTTTTTATANGGTSSTTTTALNQQISNDLQKSLPNPLHSLHSTYSSHMQLNPLLLPRNNPLNTSNTKIPSLNRYDSFIKNSNQTKQLISSKDDRMLTSPAERLLYSGKLKKLPPTRDGKDINHPTTPKLPPVKVKNDSTKYCATCHRKTGIAASYICRCGNNYCSLHRNAEAHNCTFDYKTEGRKIIEHQNPLVAAPKLPKI